MKPLNKTYSTDDAILERSDVIPAPLHDTSDSVYGDTLYTLYTTSTTTDDANVFVDIIASDLVQHVGANGVKGYWVGIGINANILENSIVYAGWGAPGAEELGDPVEPDAIEERDDKQYWTYYFNAETATKHANQAYILVVRDENHDNERISYTLDFSRITRKEPIEPLDPILWTPITVTSIKDKYLFGIDLSDPNGNPLPDSLFVHYLNSAVDYLQSLLDITISETEFNAERHDYIRNDYQNWGFIQLDHNPVKYVTGIQLMYGSRPSVEIPLDWVQLDKLTGQITLFPSAGSANSLIIGQTGMLFGFQSQWDYAPMLWEVSYVAGIDENDPSMPLELLQEAIYKRAAQGILNVWGDLIIGAGIANQSVSIDGVSQSIGTTQSAMFGGASARVEAYGKDLKEVLLPALRQKFGGIRMVVV